MIHHPWIRREPLARHRNHAHGFAAARDDDPRTAGANLLGRPMHQDDADVQGTQYGNIEQDVGEVFVGDDDSIYRNDEGFFPELGDVLKNAAQVR